MTDTVRMDAPLELLLLRLAAERSGEFPDRGRNYFRHYAEIKQYVADRYYQSAGAGLARERSERYTRHDITHVDDVLRKAGQLLGFDTNARDPAYLTLHPFEVFSLVLAILLHDAGNAIRRKGHEKAPARILHDLGPIVALSSLEQRLIASIAQAHGGKGDTINNVIHEAIVEIDTIPVRARSLAAVLRLADELSENPRRADRQALEKPYDPPESVIHNLYCTVINVSIDYQGRSISIKFDVNREQLDEEFVAREGEEFRNILLVDYIAERLDKAERERHYCNRFLSEFQNFDALRITLNIYDEEGRIDQIPLILTDSGYPVTSEQVKQKEPNFDGQKLREKHCGIKTSES